MPRHHRELPYVHLSWLPLYLLRVRTRFSCRILIYTLRTVRRGQDVARPTLRPSFPNKARCPPPAPSLPPTPNSDSRRIKRTESRLRKKKPRYKPTWWRTSSRQLRSNLVMTFRNGAVLFPGFVRTNVRTYDERVDLLHELCIYPFTTQNDQVVQTNHLEHRF